MAVSYRDHRALMTERLINVEQFMGRVTVRRNQVLGNMI
jgi:hypothetical protein